MASSGSLADWNGLLDLSGLGGFGGTPLSDPFSAWWGSAAPGGRFGSSHLTCRSPPRAARGCARRTLRGPAYDASAVASGDFSIFFKRANGTTSCRSSAGASPSRGWLAQATSAGEVVRLVHGHHHQDIIDAPPVHCVVTDYVKRRRRRRCCAGRARCRVVAVVDVLAQSFVWPATCTPWRRTSRRPRSPIARALRCGPESVHLADTDCQRDPRQCRTNRHCLCSRRCRSQSRVVFRKPLEPSTDQLLRALALELLEGKLPVAINTFADLKRKVRFFLSPARYFGRELRQRHPALSFVLGGCSNVTRGVAGPRWWR